LILIVFLYLIFVVAVITTVFSSWRLSSKEYSPCKSGRDIHPNKCANHNLKTQDMKTQGSMTPPKVHNTSKTKSKDTKIYEVLSSSEV
jgi:hypothetical protein